MAWERTERFGFEQIERCLVRNGRAFGLQQIGRTEHLKLQAAFRASQHPPEWQVRNPQQQIEQKAQWSELPHNDLNQRKRRRRTEYTQARISHARWQIPKLRLAIEFAPLIRRAQEQRWIGQAILAIERETGGNRAVDAGKLELDYNPTGGKIGCQLGRKPRPAAPARSSGRNVTVRRRNRRARLRRADRRHRAVPCRETKLTATGHDRA